jgi:hypothetical protein
VTRKVVGVFVCFRAPLQFPGCSGRVTINVVGDMAIEHETLRRSA